jgi:hypothetical protein
MARLSSRGLGWGRTKPLRRIGFISCRPPFSAKISYSTARIFNCGVLGTLIDLRMLDLQTIVATMAQNDRGAGLWDQPEGDNTRGWIMALLGEEQGELRSFMSMHWASICIITLVGATALGGVPQAHALIIKSAVPSIRPRNRRVHSRD